MFDVGLTGEKSNYSKAADVYSFDEDSSEALSPEQPPGQETPVCTSTSVRESAGTEAASSSSQLNSAVQVNLQPLQILKQKLVMLTDKTTL